MSCLELLFHIIFPCCTLFNLYTGVKLTFKPYVARKKYWMMIHLVYNSLNHAVKKVLKRATLQDAKTASDEICSQIQVDWG